MGKYQAAKEACHSDHSKCGSVPARAPRIDLSRSQSIYQRLVKQFEDARFEPLRRFSVWAKGNPDTDSFAKTIVDTLHLNSLPAVVILEPTAAEPKEAARVTGYADAAALEARLGPAIHKVFDAWQAKRERAPTPTP